MFNELQSQIFVCTIFAEVLPAVERASQAPQQGPNRPATQDVRALTEARSRQLELEKSDVAGYVAVRNRNARRRRRFETAFSGKFDFNSKRWNGISDGAKEFISALLTESSVRPGTLFFSAWSPYYKYSCTGKAIQYSSLQHSTAYYSI